MAYDTHVTCSLCWVGTLMDGGLELKRNKGHSMKRLVVTDTTERLYYNIHWQSVEQNS